MTVLAFAGAVGVGASASASAATGAPTVGLTTVQANSLVYATGNDWDNAVARTVPSTQTMVNQVLDASSGDTYWLQRQTVAVAAAGTAVSINDTAPITDQWNYTAVEIESASSGSSTPGAPTAATAIAGNASATVSWSTPPSGNSPISSYTVTPFVGSTARTATTVTGSPPATSTTVPGLTNGTAYTFQVTATNAAGPGPASATSNSVTPTASPALTLPDLKVLVPTSTFSIATAGHTRLLQYTHQTENAGTGPFELRPSYNPTTGIATFSQALYTSPSPGVWQFAKTVPLPHDGVFNPPSDYLWPLSGFTLYAQTAGGGIGTQVAASPKSLFCITEDAHIGDVPNTPVNGSPSYDPAHCTDPNGTLGMAVGWADQYDQTDPGQSIDITKVPDGTYILRAVADPLHLVVESNSANNATDTVLKISGNSVNVLGQSNPTVVPPTVAVTAPPAGASVSGNVPLAVSTSGSITSVQYILDGNPIGAPVTTAPFRSTWTIGSTPLGPHWLSAQVTDVNGSIGTARQDVVTVASGAPPPPDTQPPTVAITTPTGGQTLSGSVPVSANASDDVAIASVQLLLDGNPLGSPVTTAPYSTSWNTIAATNGTHVMGARATDTSGNVGTATTVAVTVQNPTPPMICFLRDVNVTAMGVGTVTTPTFHTGLPGELLLAFGASDGPATGKQTLTVSGAGLTWKLIQRANAQAGTAEVWAATATGIVSGTVTAAQTRGSYSQSLNVVGLQGTNGTGASAAVGASSGAPTIRVTTTHTNSLIFGVGNDWDNAIARTVGSNQSLASQYLSPTGDTFWSQYTTLQAGPAGSVVTLNDTAPSSDRYNLAAVEVIGAAS